MADEKPTESANETQGPTEDAKAKFRAALEAKKARSRAGAGGGRDGGGPGEGHTAAAHGHKVFRRKSG